MQSVHTCFFKCILAIVALFFSISSFAISLKDLISEEPKLNASSISNAISEFRKNINFSVDDNNLYELAYLEQEKSLSGSIQSLKEKHQGSKWKQRRFDLFNRDINLVKSWSEDENISESAKNMRRLYLALVFKEANEDVIEGEYPYDGRGILATQNVNYPCVILKRFPNDGIDAFASIKEGMSNENKKAIAALGLNRKLAFNCPVITNRGSENKLQDYVNTIELVNDHGEHLWGNSLFRPKSEEVISNEINNFPVFDYQKAIALAKKGDKPKDRLSLALLKHVFEDNSFDDVSSILKELREELLDHNSLSEFALDVLKGTGNFIEGSFNGTDAELKKYLVSLSMVMNGGGFTIPCGVLIRKPELLSVTRPLFGSTYDNSLPRSDCQLENYPLPSSVSRYMASAKIPEGGWLDNHKGSMRFAHYKSQAIANQKLQLFPTQIGTNLSRDKNHLPYESWSYLNVTNRVLFDHLIQLYHQALQDLSEHYKTYFSMPETQAKSAAKAALWGVVDEGHWGKPSNTGLRYQILSGASDAVIESTLDSVDDINELEHPGLSMRYYDGAWSYVGTPDSLLMASVHRPKILAMLLEKKNTARPSVLTRLSQNNPITDINFQSEIGKTALHTAVQLNNLESVKLLLEAGADTDLKVTGSRRHSLVHADRTVAMYAASYADLNILRLLQSEGVAFDVQDSMGSNPVQYLLGNRYLDINPNLNLSNFKEYLEIIAPWMLVDSGKRILPRFDCQKATTFVENRLCSNQMLAALDRMLMISYKRSRNEGDANIVRKEQLSWLKERNLCINDDCISKQYQSRIKELAGL